MPSGMIVRTILVISIGLASASQLVAQELTAQRPLTDALVRGFGQAVVDMSDWANSYAAEFDAEGFTKENFDGENMSEYLSALAVVSSKAEKAQVEFNNIVRRHGFLSIEDWEAMSSRILEAWIAIKVEESQESFGEELTEGLNEGLLSALSPEDRKAMRDALAQAAEEIKAMQSSVPANDRDVVSRNLDVLEKFFGEKETKN